MVINPTSSSQEIMSLNLKTETLDERQGNLMEIPSISYAFAPQLQFLNFAAQIYSLVAKHRDKFGREAKYYELEPLVALVNEIVKAFGDPRTIGSLSGSPTFVQVYDKMIDDGFMIAPRLNPESVLAKLTGVLWLYISREGEVSAPLKDVLFHVAKYAQCMFSTARLLAPVSVEQQKRSQIRIVLCRRGDATFRKPYILSNQLEFEGSGKPFYYYAMLANVFRNRPDPSQYNRFLRLTHDDGMSSAGTIPHIEAVSENLSALQLPEACINVDGLPENPAKHSLVSTEHTDCQVFGGKAIGKLRIHLEVPQQNGVRMRTRSTSFQTSQSHYKSSNNLKRIRKSASVPL
ncbi:hypothetical protein BDZ97DRAFT_134081 [Flammula alnicola]|nr:hypothetical protein BDZ97DRAFT_134081 [Flammula alnicola]